MQRRATSLLSALTSRPSGGSRRGVLAAINVTPLVDVCLVMLIIFMVTPILPNLTSQATLELPATRKAPELPAAASQLTLSIRADGATLLDSRLVAEPDLPAALHTAWLHGPNRPVVVRADRHLKYSAVLAALRDLNAAGFSHAGLATGRLASRRTAE
jgi:biopolymer transport protein TolR